MIGPPIFIMSQWDWIPSSKDHVFPLKKRGPSSHLQQELLDMVTAPRVQKKLRESRDAGAAGWQNNGRWEMGMDLGKFDHDLPATSLESLVDN